jgi:integrase
VPLLRAGGEGPGLPEIRLHGLRHTYVTPVPRACTNPRVGSERLGHATIAITRDTCSHAIPAMQEEEALPAGAVRAWG